MEKLCNDLLKRVGALFTFFLIRITLRSMCFITSIRYVDNTIIQAFIINFTVSRDMTNFEIFTLDPEVLHYSCWLHG